MILKEKDAYIGTDDRGFYGHRQEKDVAFHLRREFGENEQIFIINDLLIEDEGERAQIDHLVIHPYGFIIIESKSIVGEAKVNAQGEWSRSYRDQWGGMPSPIRQAELQEKLLKSLLSKNVEQLLGKLLGIQTKVRGRDWQVLCAVSSSVILHRDEMPKDVSDKVVKTEFLAEKVRALVGSTSGSLLKGKPRFPINEMENIGSFLLKHTEQLACKKAQEQSATHAGEAALSQEELAEKAQFEKLMEEARQLASGSTESQANGMAAQGSAVEYVAESAATYLPENAAENVKESSAESAINDHRLVCKKCDEATKIVGMYGQYGYYIKCTSCGTNTAMKKPCPACEQRTTWVSKSGPTYTATCRSCEHRFVIHQDSN